jgi:hypothetical protein
MGTVQWLHGKLLALSCFGAIGFLRNGVCCSPKLKFSLKSKCSLELTIFLQKVSKVQAGGEECKRDPRSTPRHALFGGHRQCRPNPPHCMQQPQCFTARAALAAFSNAYRSHPAPCISRGRGLGAGGKNKLWPWSYKNKVQATSWATPTEWMAIATWTQSGRQAATQQAVRQAKGPLKKKRAAAEILNTQYRCRSYKKGLFRKQWDKHLTL